MKIKFQNFKTIFKKNKKTADINYIITLNSFLFSITHKESGITKRIQGFKEMTQLKLRESYLK